MTEADAKLAAFLADGAPPVRDAQFRLAVLARLERRRVHRRLALVGAIGLAGVAVTLAVAPNLNAMASARADAMAVAMSAIALAWAVAALTPGLSRLT